MILTAKRDLSFLFLSFCFFQTFAQKEIKGRVLDNQHRKPVAAATVTLHPAGSESILNYTMTADDGTFTLKSNNMPDSVTVMVSAMTLERQFKTVVSDVTFIEFMVKEKTTKLNEVIVKAPKIRQRGDTLDYSVSSFLNETDRSIGDVLKRLPGIQVLPSGQILYQNKEISKFYVEGMDLLKGKYGLATNNIDATQVATVQVLENHQPIKVLKNMELPESAAINLKLKQSALGAFFLTAQVGAGLPDMLLSNELVGMRFTRAQQNMLVYKGDNTGRDIANELTSFYDIIGNDPMQFLSIQAPSPPEINGQHYLFNDAHLFSLNDLRKTKKDLTITGNLNYLMDKQKSSSFSKRDIFVEQGETIHISEDLNARLAKRELEGSVTLEGNTDHYFLENRLHVISKWNENVGNVVSSENIAQLLKQPSFQIENDFSYIRRKKDRRFRIGSKVSYLKQNHSLAVSPILFDDFIVDITQKDSTLQQNVSFDHFAANLYLSRGKEMNRFSFDYKALAFTNLYDMNSGLMLGDNTTVVANDSLKNQIKRNEMGAEFSFWISYKVGQNGRVSLDMPLKYLHLERKDEIRDTHPSNEYLLFNPRLGFQSSLSTRISLVSNVSYNNNIGSLREDYLGYIMTTYRSLNKNDGLLNKNRNLNAYTSLSYKNPFTTMFTDLRLSYSNSRRNLLYDVRYNGILSNSVSIVHPNRSQSFGAGFSLGKSIDAIRSEVKLNGSYNLNMAITMNQGIISDFHTNSFSVSPSITTDVGRFLIMKYDASYSDSRNVVGNTSLKPIHNFTQSFKTSFLPVKKLILNISFNHYYNNLIESESRSSWFGNAGVKYKTKNVDWMLDWTNVFNIRQFVTYSYDEASSYYSEYGLRSSEVLVTVRFKIL
ncbi:MAG: carboxypeptidase-like regulatory domain-containing protein [Candidatus Saccharimonadaceae bacterium]